MDDRHTLPHPLHVGRPNLGSRDRLMERLNGALDRLYLTDGPLVREFENELTGIAATRHCVAVCNATTGIQIAARASGIKGGDEVIVPAFTWVATPQALEWIGVVPVFCDADEETGNIDPAHAERLIGPRTRGILGVHVFGRPCPVDDLEELARRHGITLLFDAAHALGCTYRGRPVGGFGAAEVFSFHATKFVNSFEGGAIVTDDPELAERARAMRNFGIGPDGTVGSGGTNAKMNEGVAAMGLTSLEVMEDLMVTNREHHLRYRQGLAGIPGVSVRQQAPGERSNHQYLVIEVDAARAGIHRDELHAALTSRNVLSRRYFAPACHRVEPYLGDPARHAPLPLPRAEALSERVLALPTGTAVSETDVKAVCALIRELVPTDGGG
ncbi:aminotransferase class I/II-fold pyridoxal phosphate-dependent enzyme [Streptomyces sp. ST2-7A]|uniref:aminotransferase class I/II-fold pyridoxal phosphate-dependent enzyme n=1 Tax=Streptomyces sp. ST2-7A TaxID=2907214 RepID=UPI001F28A21C|nr:aminotransferase class I/II-fold pyridoxal phosphate-dependent enzyme [Streptomyces sp. ST2-7A]MCE7080556.1 aminotransferase class I/II-fold pyridoxal phosphate-dependent enzyme [Streptomyces sp. ST2-7A]